MNNALSYVYDFISMIWDDENLKKDIKSIILFGSVAKGVYDNKSDIDLFFDIKNRVNVKGFEKRLKLILKSFEIKAENTWNLKGIKFPLNFIVGSLEDETWKNLREEIISSGIMLYGSFKEIPDNLKHYFLFFYSLRNLDRKGKMKFIRKFLGYNIKKNKKEYPQKGLLEQIGGTKLGPNVILISSESILDVKNILNKFRIKYKIKEIWERS